jgi:hypothetical protein
MNTVLGRGSAMSANVRAMKDALMPLRLHRSNSLRIAWEVTGFIEQFGHPHISGGTGKEGGAPKLANRNEPVPIEAGTPA